ncbi:excinuclease ABC subunit C, partial [Candidatus Gottesmanbacteria bacterium]|nr:excinuclease ABC subunit C [Candidatus Gottesmanbacteria bacterium]
ILSNYFPLLGAIKKIECYDISNISGRLATGSLVTFIDGDPDKNFYRRFRIKTKSTPDDFAMLSEVLKRRLSHTDWPLPDLIIVDGGKPQVSTMSKILEDQNLTIPLVGLAKREEQIILLHNDNFVTLSLKVGSGALSLVQRLRDEAHRFAHKYHQLLRLKALIKT